MKKVFTILLCKILRWIGKRLGKGSSLPGKIALKICPDILERISLPDYIIAVTGSNGKTSTVEMIAHILTENNKKVAWNKEGSNQIEGVTTLVLNSATLSGKVKADILLIESDERFARHTFRYIKPTHYVITNLYRDQLTRNGHPEWVYDALRESIHPGVQLILNADDPLVSCFGHKKNDVIWFGADRLEQDEIRFNGVYHDGKYCPVCKHPMEYSTFHYDHIGHYACTHCDFKRQEAKFKITEVDLREGTLVINYEHQIHLQLKSLYNIYNILAAFTVASQLGIEEKGIVKAINGFVAKNGRVVTFTLGGRKGILLTSKHENSISYNQSLRIAAAHERACEVLIIVDAVSRKYFTSDVSWLWDIDFEKLKGNNVKKILLAGTYCNDLAVRFSYTGIAEDKIQVLETVEQAVEALNNEREEDIFVITCFSDKDKFLQRVTLQ